MGTAGFETGTHDWRETWRRPTQEFGQYVTYVGLAGYNNYLSTFYSVKYDNHVAESAPIISNLNSGDLVLTCSYIRTCQMFVSFEMSSYYLITGT